VLNEEIREPGEVTRSWTVNGDNCRKLCGENYGDNDLLPAPFLNRDSVNVSMRGTVKAVSGYILRFIDK
jgi:hypothetical protein